MAANRAGRTGDGEETTRGTEAGTSETAGAAGTETGGEAGAGGGTQATGRSRGGRAAAGGGAGSQGTGGRSRRSRTAGAGAGGGGTAATRARGGTAGGGAGAGGGDAGAAGGGGRGRSARQRGGAAGGRGGGRGGRAGGRTAGRGARATGSEQPDLRTDLRDWAAARPQGWGHQDWESLLGDLGSRGHDVSDRDAVGRQLEQQKLALRLESVQGMGRARVQSLVERFGTLYSLQRASVDEIAEVSNITRALAERIKEEVG